MQLDKLLLAISSDQLDKHTMEVKKQKDSSIELASVNAKLAHQNLTSHCAKVFINNIVQSVSYTKSKLSRPPNVLPAEAEPPKGQGVWWKVVSESKTRHCFVGNEGVFCTCLEPSRFGYPCRHVIHLNGSTPFVIGTCFDMNIFVCSLI